MSGELIVSASPQDMSAREAIQWGIDFSQTFTSAPTDGTVYVYDITYGDPGSDVTSTMMPAGAVTASSGTVIAPLMYGSAGTVAHKYKIVFLAVQSNQRGEQQLFINLKP